MSIDKPNSGIVFFLKREYVLILPVVAGCFLRLYMITEQIIADDEWHGIHAIFTFSYHHIFSHFGFCDYCIPLAAYYKFMAENFFLSEMVVRTPELFFGIISLVIFPLVVRNLINRRVGNVFACFLAISPIHIFYSRYARPYVIVVFFSFLGLIAFYKWLHGGRDKRWLWTYIVCAIIGPYFHLTVLPVLFAPLCILVGDKLIYKNDIPVKEIIKLFVIVLAALGILLSLPVVVGMSDLSGKLGHDRVSLDTVYETFKLFIGVYNYWILYLALPLIIAGILSIVKFPKKFLLYLSILFVLQLVFSIFSNSSNISIPMVLARYCLSLQPFVILLLSAGFIAFYDFIKNITKSRIFSYMVSFTVFALFVFFYPLKNIYYFPNNWTNHPKFQAYYGDTNPEYSLHPEKIPKFYYQLATLPKGNITILEVPWYYEWSCNTNYTNYQFIHGQYVMIGFVGGLYAWTRSGELPVLKKGIAFRHFYHVSLYKSLPSKIKYVVFHKNLQKETGYPVEYIDVTPWIKTYTDVFGKPVYEDSLIVVFDVLS
ncbi:MAG: glycosyltransferase family 39 protein [Nitrospirae bacterium]|nr:glycosyltransferase family 39 protein [Nitrospirota bacterium]MBF0535087.1 glycosyltransferase family 39 protein [Nitrospirota bacterium]MBF0615363.1 glycosyltransferase family 39 protein [Nitrospirota bacterium]